MIHPISFSLLQVLSLVAWLRWQSADNPRYFYESIELQRHSQPAVAIERARQASAQFSRPANDWSWRFRLLYADILIEQGKAEMAGDLLNFSAPSEEANIRLQAAKAYQAYALGNGKPARDLMVQLPASDHCWAAEVLIHKGQAAVHNLVGRREDALRDAAATLSIASSQAEGCRDYYWRTLARVAWASYYEEQYRYEQQSQQLQAALAQARGRNFVRLIPLIRGNLALAYYNLGDFSESLAILNEAERYHPLGDNRLLGIDLGHRARTKESLNDNQGSIRDYSRALKILESVQEPIAAAYYARFLDELTSVYIRIEQLEEAAQINRDLLSSPIADPRVVASAHLNFASILRHRGKVKEALAELQKVDTQDPAVIWRLQSERAQALADAGRNTQAVQNFKASLETAKQARGKLDDSWSRITFFGHLKGLYSAYIDFLVDHNERERAIQLAEESRALTLAELLHREPNANPRRLVDIARSRNAVILSYWIGAERSYLWVTKATGSEVFKLTLPNLQTHIEGYNATLYGPNNPLATPRRAQELFNELIAQALPTIPANAQVIIVPDGPLTELNFETLIPPGRPRFWIEDIASLVVAPSLAVMQSAPETKLKGRLLFIDDPKLKGANQTRGALTALFPDITELSLATPENIRAAHPEQFSILHFSAHAKANETSPLDSFILLQGDESSAHELFAHDLMSMRLSAHLVTLADCQSAGKATLPGEGLIGLAWAVLSAGAHNVVASLWNVEDTNSADLMIDFYTNLEHGWPPEQALNAAKRFMIRKRPRPYYWAGFQLYSR